MLPALPLILVSCTPHHDVFIRNANIWTNDPQNPTADSMRICNGMFAEVGNDLSGQCPNARNLAMTSSVALDAHGARIIPGLIDSHLHLISGGLQLSRLQLRDVPDRRAFIAAIAERARQTPKGGWILGGRWSTESWPDSTQPNKDWIDAVTRDHPVLLSRMDGHGALTNSVALRLAGIDKNGPPNPPGGQIERDPATNEPTGILKDTAIGLVGRLVPAPTAAELDAALVAAMNEANRHGLTCVHTMSPWSDVAVLDRANRVGKLTLRTRVYVMEDDWREYIDKAKAHGGDDWVRVCGFKQFADGSLGSRTAYMSAAYADRDPHGRECCGLAREILAPDTAGAGGTAATPSPPAASLLVQLCCAAHRAGLDSAIHSIGDRANHEVLDAYEAVEAASAGLQASPNSNSARLRIEHSQHLRPEDISRFARLGVVASMQPYHKADDGRYAEKAIGPERCKTSYAFRALLDSGAHVAFGSDWPVVSLNPFLGIHAAVTGRTLDGKVFVPEQNITVEEALRCYTGGAAYAAGDAARLGVIKAGNPADFVILKSDIMRAPADSLDKIEVEATYVGGSCVWKSRGL